MAPRIIFIFIHSFKYETIETHTRAFLILNTLAIGRVSKYLGWCIEYVSILETYHYFVACMLMMIVGWTEKEDPL